MQLDRGNTSHVGDTSDPFRALFINEYAHARHLGRQLFDDAARLLRRDIARAALVKVEAQHVNTRTDAYKRVFEVCNAADFDTHHILTSSLSNERPQSVCRIVCPHQHFTNQKGSVPELL